MRYQCFAAGLRLAKGIQGDVVLKYSLILATIGRSIEVERFLASLDRQTYRSFELIVVDQNDDDRVSSMLESYRDNFEIIYLKSKPGLSIARNRGLQEVSGDIVAFPDDDCWYPPNLLEAITQIFSRYDIDIVTGQSRDEENRHSQRFWSSKPSVADVISVWKLAISYTVFIRRYSVESLGGFDVELGVGANSQWQSGEETDYLIRAIVKGYRVCYFPEVFVYHPQKTQSYDKATITRARVYGAGMGRVMKKNRYSRIFVYYMLLRPIGGLAFSMLTLRLRKARYYLAVCRGRYAGWKS